MLPISSIMIPERRLGALLDMTRTCHVHARRSLELCAMGFEDLCTLTATFWRPSSESTRAGVGSQFAHVQILEGVVKVFGMHGFGVLNDMIFLDLHMRLSLHGWSANNTTTTKAVMSCQSEPNLWPTLWPC